MRNLLNVLMYFQVREEMWLLRLFILAPVMVRVKDANDFLALISERSDRLSAFSKHTYSTSSHCIHV